MIDSYQKLVAAKQRSHIPPALQVDGDIHAALYPFQRALVRWALRRGRAAIFADCGLGKTLMQLVWAEQIPGRTLILAPLAVAQQTIAEGARFGIAAHYARSDADAAGHRIVITNYEMLERFDCTQFAAVVLDESSILKSYDGKFRQLVTDSFRMTPYKLCCTATPAPNDHMELGTHSEFLGYLSRSEMLAKFFVHDGGETQIWRLKKHAQKAFWKWLASFCAFLRSPADIGFDQAGFDLPPMTVDRHYVGITSQPTDTLFVMPASTLGERIAARRESVPERCERAAAIVLAEPSESWVVWCNLNSENDALVKFIPGAVAVKGSDEREHKLAALDGFASGSIKVLITKPSIAGFGMNWQHCARMIFVGLSDSWEQYYQATRRCWRFGQLRPVSIHHVIAETEGNVVDNLKRKEKEADSMAAHMIQEASAALDLEHTPNTLRSKIERIEYSNIGWRLIQDDCINALQRIESNHVGFSVFSPPFASLYTYSDLAEDMGNGSRDEFWQQFGYLPPELLRVTKPGRLCSVHCMNLPTSKQSDGFIGILDFRGDMIRSFVDAGWIFHSEVCIWKDPVTAMQRTKALGLLHKQLKKDSVMSRQGIPDYLITFRKPGENVEPVTKTNETMPVSVWQRYASPVWMDINPSDTLQFRSARDHDDERHICPLQLGVIRRAIELWTNEGDLVFSPFAGIGSEGHVALEMGRQFLGIELKESYAKQAAANLAAVTAQQRLFNLTPATGQANLEP